MQQTLHHNSSEDDSFSLEEQNWQENQMRLNLSQIRLNNQLSDFYKGQLDFMEFFKQSISTLQKGYSLFNPEPSPAPEKHFTHANVGITRKLSAKYKNEAREARESFLKRACESYDRYYEATGRCPQSFELNIK
jgi:hypothetical protein